MYVRIDGLGQPGSGSGSGTGLPGNVVPMPPQRPPWIPPPGGGGMPNPGLVPAPVPLTMNVALVRSRLQCTAGQRTAITAALGPGAVVTADVIANAVAEAHNNLWLDLTDPSGPPRANLLVATPSLTTVSLFTQAFGAAPTSLPWPGAKRNLGWIVATRLGGARKTMFSSSVRISCWGYPWSGGGVDRPLDYMVKAMPKAERVGFGALFWRAVAKSDEESMAGSILAAGLVIRYGVSYRLLAKPLSNLHCYLKYALTMLGKPVPAWVTAKCPVAT